MFANPDPHAGPLSEGLGDLPEVVAEHGLDVDSLRFKRRVPYEIKANWKIAVENYLECIHCPVNHPSFLEVIDERNMEMDAVRQRASQFNPVHPRSLDGRGPIDAHGEVGSAQFHLWFPTMKFNVLPGHPNLSIGPLWPTGPVTCAAYLDYFFAESIDEQWIDDVLALDTQVGAEEPRWSKPPSAGLPRGWSIGAGSSAVLRC